jgi:hypothetical protein
MRRIADRETGKFTSVLPRRRIPVIATMVAAAALCGLTATGASAAPPCGAGSVAAAGAVDGVVAARIYQNELAGSEVSADVGHIMGASDLAAAVATDNAAAAWIAVQRIVFHPHWHIVRLRVLDRSGRVLADIGGAHDIAPVGGPLRAHGAVVGSFSMSVQDDIGVAKLESRFVGDPIGLYVGGKLVASEGGALPASQPTGASVVVRRVSYRVVREVDRAFPSGIVTLVLLVPAPPAATAALPCTAVRAAEYGKVAERFARLAVNLPAHYAPYAATVTLYSGAHVFVRDGGQQLASSGGAGPATIPRQGTVAYRGTRWLVFSFVAQAPARIYVLSPSP